MLDQNTDRMWYVIGAVLVGAAIILIANGTLPQMFASVTSSFESVVQEIDLKLYAPPTEDEWFKGATMIIETNRFDDLSSWDGSDYTIVNGVSVPEWDVDNASRITTTGGASSTKVVKTYISNANLNDKYEYLLYVKIKNIGDNPMRFHSNVARYKTSSHVVINPGETKVIHLSVQKPITAHLQMNIGSLNSNKDIDFIIHDFKLGYREKGD